MTLAGDLRYAIRGLIRRPGFTAVAVLTLALGIGANAAIFSAVRGILLRPLPFRAPDRLVAFNAEQFISNAELLFLRDNARTLNGVAAISPGWGMALTGVGEATQLTTARVSPNLLDVLGVRPMLGRTFRENESIPGQETVAILGHSLWAERFGSDPIRHRPQRGAGWHTLQCRRRAAAGIRGPRAPRRPLDAARDRPHAHGSTRGRCRGSSGACVSG